MVLGLTFVLRWAATGDARVARDDGCESVERRGGWRRRCSHGAGPGTVMRGREVGRREVEGSAVRRRRVGMPCGFAGEVELVTSDAACNEAAVCNRLRLRRREQRGQAAAVLSLR